MHNGYIPANLLSFQTKVEEISGRMLNAAANKKSQGFPKIRIAAASINGPGSNSIAVGVNFLKMVQGVVIKPCGIQSRRKCSASEPALSTVSTTASPAPERIITVVSRQEEAICVVGVMKTIYACIVFRTNVKISPLCVRPDNTCKHQIPPRLPKTSTYVFMMQVLTFTGRLRKK